LRMVGGGEHALAEALGHFRVQGNV
jgi:hypothetical protein